MTRILLLGGTTEAGALARLLAGAGCDAVYSYAGRTEQPQSQPLPQRIGGFGGVAGLQDYLARERITHVIDATHPFAAQMSQHAVLACAASGCRLLALERAPWQPGPGDRWIDVPDMTGAVAALPQARARVFLAIGKLHLADFAARPGNHYLLRLVDPPGALPLADCAVELARGPFDVAQDLALLQRHRIDLVVAKNAGGTGAAAKLEAARLLGLPVVMVARPAVPDRPAVATPAEALEWLRS